MGRLLEPLVASKLSKNKGNEIYWTEKLLGAVAQDSSRNKFNKLSSI